MTLQENSSTKPPEPLEFLALRSARVFLDRYYGSARIELAAGNCDRAESHLNAMIEGCDIQGKLHFKAFSICGLGEVAFVRCNSALAAQRFAEIHTVFVHRDGSASSRSV
jgi:hypothetical protein